MKFYGNIYVSIKGENSYFSISESIKENIKED